jgi:hypothetical protein
MTRVSGEGGVKILHFVLIARIILRTSRYHSSADERNKTGKV